MASHTEKDDQLVLADPVPGPAHTTHTSWFCCLEREKEMARRIQNGDCVIVYSHDEIHGNDLRWCLTHNQLAAPDHAPWVKRPQYPPDQKEAG